MQVIFCTVNLIKKTVFVVYDTRNVGIKLIRVIKIQGVFCIFRMEDNMIENLFVT